MTESASGAANETFGGPAEGSHCSESDRVDALVHATERAPARTRSRCRVSCIRRSLGLRPEDSAGLGQLARAKAQIAWGEESIHARDADGRHKSHGHMHPGGRGRIGATLECQHGDQNEAFVGHSDGLEAGDRCPIGDDRGVPFSLTANSANVRNWVIAEGSEGARGLRRSVAARQPRRALRTARVGKSFAIRPCRSRPRDRARPHARSASLSLP